MKKVEVILGVLLLLFIGVVSAPPPVFQSVAFSEGYEIKIQEQGLILQDQDYSFNFHIFNISNGVQINNQSTSCYFHLYGEGGSTLLETEPIFSDASNVDNEWELTILGGNFSTSGDYAYIIQCNSTTLGGFESIGITVSKIKTTISISESLVYILLTLGVFLIFGLSLYFTLVIPYGNKTNEKGAVIKIAKTKYFKLLMIGVTYAFFVWLLNILIGVSDNFVSLTLYYGFVSFLFTLFLNLTLPVFIILLIISFFELIKDANIMKEIKKFGSSNR